MPSDAPAALHAATHADTLAEARRQIGICNACRYCEGYCAVFPAIAAQRDFSNADAVQLANLCHNCRGCHYACQYAPPHAFALTLPAILAQTRVDSWERLAWPAAPARALQRSGGALAAGLAACIGLMLLAILALPGGGAGFYAHLSHAAMAALFLPAALFPLVSLGVSLRRYWREVGGAPLRPADLAAALRDAARMKNLSGGQGQGCNFEAEARFSPARAHAHQAMMWGFALCFLATCAATVMHYALGWEAPYGPLSAPKLLGGAGGALMLLGGAGLLALRRRADPALGAPGGGGAETGFILLLTLIAASGLALWGIGGAALLALHLGAVLALFLLAPFTRMAHPAYRLAALARDAQRKRG